MAGMVDGLWIGCLLGLAPGLGAGPGREPSTLRVPAPHLRPAAVPPPALRCADNAEWRDLDGNGCGNYTAEGWCEGSYFRPGFESKAARGPAPGPAEQCCACGKMRGGCLQARLDQHCLQSGAGAYARKNALVWNCFGGVGHAQRDDACVNAYGRFTRCAIGVSPSADAGAHADALGSILRQGCLSSLELERRKRERAEAKRAREAAVARGEMSGSCMQDAMDQLCDAAVRGSVSRRSGSQFLCCSKTRQPTPVEGEEASYACVDQNGFFAPCAPCDTSDPARYRDQSEQLHAVMRHGCRAPKLVGEPSARPARSRARSAGERERTVARATHAFCRASPG